MESVDSKLRAIRHFEIARFTAAGLLLVLVVATLVQHKSESLRIFIVVDASLAVAVAALDWFVRWAVRRWVAATPSRHFRIVDHDPGFSEDDHTVMLHLVTEDDGVDVDLGYRVVDVPAEHRAALGNELMIHWNERYPRVILVDWKGTNRLVEESGSELWSAGAKQQLRTAAPAPSCTTCGGILEVSRTATSARCPYCRALNYVRVGEGGA